MGKTKKFNTDWWGFIVSGGGILVALFTLGVQMIDFGLITINDNLATILYIIACIIFITGIIIQAAKPQKELNARRELNPKIVFEGKYELYEIPVNITISETFLDWRDTQTMGATGSHVIPRGTSKQIEENHLYLCLYLKNLPKQFDEESTAKNLQINIIFKSRNGKKIMSVEGGRWWDEDTKLYPESYYDILLKKANIFPGEEERMVLAFVNLDGHGNMYSFAYNSHERIFEKEKMLLGKDPVIAQLSFWGSNLNPTRPIEIGLIPGSKNITVIYPLKKKLLRKDYSTGRKDV